MGDTVLVLHGGFGAEHSYLLDMVEPLTDEYHFVLFDQRGSLRSPVADSLLTIQNLIEDIEWIREELNLDKLTLLGHSMGTRLAMAYTDAYPDNVKNLVFVSATYPSMRIPEGITDFSKVPPPKFQLATQYLQNRPEVKNMLKKNGLDKDLKELNYRKRSDRWRINFSSVNMYDITKWKQMAGGMAFYNGRSSQLLARSEPEPYHYTNSLRKTNVPVTVIAGDHDYGNFEALSYNELYRAVSDSVVTKVPENLFASSWRDFEDQLPQLEFYSIEKAGHNPWIDQPDKLNKLLLQALKRL